MNMLILRINFREHLHLLQEKQTNVFIFLQLTKTYYKSYSSVSSNFWEKSKPDLIVQTINYN